MAAATKAEIQKQVEEIERAVDASSSEDSDDYSDDDDDMLSRRIKQNEQSKADNFTLLYIVVAVVTTFCPTYLFMTILDMDPLEPLNAGLYLVVAGLTCYFLVEAYKQMYDTESRKAAQGEDGKVVSTLEKRLNEKVHSLDGADFSSLPKVADGQTKARTPQEIFHSDQAGAEWKSLSDAQQREYRTQSIQEEVQILRADIADYRHLQTQCAMGWSLFFCNGTFISISGVISFGLLRSYDPRVSFVVSTFLVGLLVQLLAKQNDEAAKNASDKKKKNH